MSEMIGFLVIVALGVALRRAFVRIDELQRAAGSLRDRLAAMEMASSRGPARNARSPPSARGPKKRCWSRLRWSRLTQTFRVRVHAKHDHFV